MARHKKNQLSLEFTGFDELKKQLIQLGGDATKRAVEGAMRQTQQAVAQKAKKAMASHNKTGKTSAAIRQAGKIDWVQTTASIDIGFGLRDEEGFGYPSIFLMYGTELYGQPHVKPDRNLFDAVYGKETKKEAHKAQEEAFHKVIERVMK